MVTPGATVIDDAVAGQRGVERERRVLGGDHRAEALR